MKRIIILLGLLALTAGLAQAQTSNIPADLAARPFRDWQLDITTGGALLMLLGRAYNGLRTRGGLVGMIRSVLFGESVPQVIAADYKKELAPQPSASVVDKVGLLVLGLSLAGLTIGGLSGCSTITSPSTWNETTVARVTAAVRLTTTTAVSAVVVKDPEAAPTVRAIADALLLAADATHDPATISALVTERAGGNALVTSGFTLALGIYQTFYALNVEQSLAAKPAFKAVLLAIAEGAKAGAGGLAGTDGGALVDLSLSDMKLR